MVMVCTCLVWWVVVVAVMVGWLNALIFWLDDLMIICICFDWGVFCKHGVVVLLIFGVEMVC